MKPTVLNPAVKKPPCTPSPARIELVTMETPSLPARALTSLRADRALVRRHALIPPAPGPETPHKKLLRYTRERGQAALSLADTRGPIYALPAREISALRIDHVSSTRKEVIK